MTTYFETKVTYDKMNERGEMKKTTERYLVDAMSFTEAEARINDEMRPQVHGEYAVKAVKKSNIEAVLRAEVKDPDDDRFLWYKAKVMFRDDEAVESEKLTPAHYLVCDNDILHVAQVLFEYMDGGFGFTNEWKIASIAETDIIDVLPQKTD